MQMSPHFIQIIGMCGSLCGRSHQQMKAEWDAAGNSNEYSDAFRRWGCDSLSERASET